MTGRKPGKIRWKRWWDIVNCKHAYLQPTDNILSNDELTLLRMVHHAINKSDKSPITHEQLKAIWQNFKFNLKKELPDHHCQLPLFQMALKWIHPQNSPNFSRLQICPTDQFSQFLAAWQNLLNGKNADTADIVKAKYFSNWTEL